MGDERTGDRWVPAELLDLVERERVAYAPVRGYLYQSVLAVRRWLLLAEGELLLVEGGNTRPRLRGSVALPSETIAL